VNEDAAANPSPATVDAIKARLRPAFDRELDQIAKLLAQKESTAECFGAAEFQLRDLLLRLGAAALDAGLEEVKKKNTKDQAVFALDATNRRRSKDIDRFG
jgi:hypothetical protein